ncbi:flagellar biosynthesis protein FlhF [Alcaligenaceae bacterium C4P045]|nr:flagellar biosynthesis protein FlhF [Alcaligenaceae bacterium C4P045]
MRLVRDALGPDALIVSNRRVDGGIEVMAASADDSLDEHDDAQSDRQRDPRSSSGERSDGMSDGAFQGAGSERSNSAAAAVPSMPSYARPHTPAPSLPAYAIPHAPAPIHRGASAYAAAMLPSEAPPQVAVVERSSASAMSTALNAVLPLPQSAASQAPSITPQITAPRVAAAQVTAAQVTAAQVPAPESPAPAVPSTHVRPAAPQMQAPMPPATARMSTPTPHVSALSASPAAAAAPAGQPAIHSAASSTQTADAGVGAQLQDAISSLQRTFETRIEGLMWGKGALGQPAGAALFRGLLEAGFSAPLARALLERLPKGYSAEQALAWARKEITTHLPLQVDESPLWETGGVFALVGPTGVGKTTTLAKLAARCVARVGRDQVAMLTTDNFRIGAVEQLQIYGQLLSIPTRSVRDAASLRQTLEEWGNRRIVLIDTTGISQRDRKLAQQAAMLMGGGRPVRRLLVLNAASQGDTLDEVAHAYRHGVGEDVCGCVITKLDEASRLGAVLDTAIRHRLPIHYVAGGQKVPEDFSLPSAARLVDHAFSSVAADKPLFAADESDMAALWGAATERAEARDTNDLQAQRRKLLSLAQPFDANSGHAEQAFKALNASLEVLTRDATFLAARADWAARQVGTSGADNAAAGSSESAPTTARTTIVDGARAYQSMVARHATGEVLAVHGKVSTRGWHAAAGNLSSALWIDAEGRSLGAPLHQLILGQGTLSSFSDGTESRTADEAIRARIAVISPAAVDTQIVHLLDAAPRALCQALSVDGVRWVSRYAGSTRIVHDECPTTLQAVGKSLGYLPVDLSAHPALFAQLVGGVGSATGADLRAGDMTVWAAATMVSPTGRQAGAPSWRMVTVKWIDPVSGAIRNQLYGMSNIGAQEADVHAMVVRLLQQDAGRKFFVLLTAALATLPPCSPTYGLARRVADANRLAAACWRLTAAADAAPLRTLMTALSGKAALTPKGMPVAVARLFAMLDMTAAG